MSYLDAQNLRYRFVNKAFAEMFGFSPEYIRGKHVSEILGAEAYAQALPSIDRARAGERIVFDHVRLVRGEPRWFSISYVPECDDHGSVQNLVVLSVDITERKQAEADLQAREHRAQRQRSALASLAVNDAIGSGDVNAATRILAETASSVFQVERSSVWVLSADGTELVCLALFEAKSGAHSEGQVLRAEDYPQYFQAIRHESRIAAEDARTDPRTCEFAPHYLMPLGITSMLDAGFSLDGRLAGVVCLEHVGEKRRWHSAEESFASTLASLMAQAMVNASRKRAE
ncbi:MAG: PAS domain-containing protein, partial [Actinomycetes bacterium]